MSGATGLRFAGVPDGRREVAYAADGGRFRVVATVEERCGRWLWEMRDGSGIGLCGSLGAARDAVRACAREGGTDFVPPTADQVASYARRWCGRVGLDPSSFDGEAFVAYHEAAGWTVKKGRRPMRDWRAAVRSWVRGTR